MTEKYLKKIHVPSGTFFCDRAGAILFQAFLSSCVGVSAYDPVHRIGGLAHFLLPEPISYCREGDEDKYASTGLPRFLDALCELGASRNHLRVCIAGGAFSGSLSHQDIHLDIGGRTAEMVRAILAEEKIRVDRSETGGFFTCCLSLNMVDGTVDISPSNPMGEQVDSPLPLVLDDIDAIMDTIQPIPQIALKILRMINDDMDHLSDLAQEVKKDQVISGQVLKYCNSAVFSGKRGIDSIEDALLIIGRDHLARIVTTVAVKNLFLNHNQGYSLVKGGLYHHAIGVALIAEKLAVINKKGLPFSAYTAGLLHDIGKIVLDQVVARYAPFFYRDFKEPTNTVIMLENKYLHTNHTLIGHTLAEKWSLPDSVRQAIAFHHQPEETHETIPIVDIVSLANLLFHMFSAGPHLDRVDMSHFNLLLERNGFSVLDFPEIVDMIPLDALTANPEMILSTQTDRLSRTTNKSVFRTVPS
jgi:putative nucleotidyltransferase with HDIG domain